MFETGCLYRAQTTLELTLHLRLTSKTWQSLCLSIQSVRISGLSHQAQYNFQCKYFITQIPAEWSSEC